MHLIDVLNLSKEEVLIIGDGKNDIELFETFPYSGCVSNSILEIKNKSSYVSKFTNNESGVAEIIEYYKANGYEFGVIKGNLDVSFAQFIDYEN